MKLYDHQKNVLKSTADKNRVAYYLDMGLGKTFVGAEKIVQLGADTNILICQKSKINDWMEHFQMYYPKIETYDLTSKKRLDEFISHDTAWAGWHGCITAIGIINYELAWRRKDLLKLKDFTLMLDESSLIQNRKAKQTKFILKLGDRAANVVLLSGTPTSGKYENLWTQAHLLGWDITESLYNRQYINWKLLDVAGGMKVKIVDKRDPYKNVERLKAKLREHGAVFMKTEDVMTLPEQNFIEVKVQKSKEYSQFMKSAIVTFDDGTELVGDTALTMHLYARQLCGQYSEAKLEAFRDLVNSTNDRLIVFYNFTEELKKLIPIVENSRPISEVNGFTKSLEAYEQFDDSITFVQYQAGAMGLNLQKANKVIYFTLPERSELFEQSKKRIHRIGQDKPCFYYIMTCAGTVEKQIYEALKQRKDFTDQLFKEVCHGR